VVRCQRHVSETAERYCDRSALSCLLAQRDPGARAFPRDLAVSSCRQTANAHHPVNTIGRVVGLSCRSTVNRNPSAGSLLPVAHDTVVTESVELIRQARFPNDKLSGVCSELHNDVE
jgi:hypothetical protein